MTMGSGGAARAAPGDSKLIGQKKKNAVSCCWGYVKRQALSLSTKSLGSENWV